MKEGPPEIQHSQSEEHNKENSPKIRTEKKLYHGSSEKIESFREDKVGTNLGLGTEGWGYYFSPSEKLTKKYGEILHTVSVEIGNDRDSFIVWDKPLTESQQQKISEKLAEISETKIQRINTLKGEGVYWLLADILKSPKEASKFLFELGIDGTINGEIITLFDNKLIKKISS